MRQSRRNQEQGVVFKQRNEHVISFRVSDEERAKLHSQAKRGGISVSKLVRMNLDILNGQRH